MLEPVIPETPETALPSIPSDALWTSDSERVEAQADTEIATDPSPPAAATPETPAVVDGQKLEDARKPSGKPRNDPAARVAQATAREAAAKEEVRQIRERADRLERELAEARRPATSPQQTAAPQPANTSGKPSWGQFESQIGTKYETWADAQDAFADARDEWKDDQIAWKSFNDEIDRTKASDPEFVKALAADPPVSAVMSEAIRSSGQRIDIMRHLGTHPELCAQLARESAQTSLDAVPVMRRYLEAQVTAGAVARPDSAPVVRPSTANPPINRVGGTASATPVDPDDLDFGPEYIRQENARERKRQETSRW